MSIQLMAMIWDTDLTSTEKLVLLKYADHARINGTSIWPSKDTTARLCSLSRRTIQITTKKLINYGYLRVEGMTKYRTTLYSINTKKLTEAAMKNGRKFAPYAKEEEEDDECNSPKSLLIKKETSTNRSKSNSYSRNEKYQPQYDENIREALKKKEKKCSILIDLKKK